MRRTVLLCLLLTTLMGAAPAVTPPPDSVFEKFRERDREVARGFYKKYLEIGGMAVLASGGASRKELEQVIRTAMKSIQ